MPQNSFDIYAKQYDEDFTFSPIGKMQRQRVHFFLRNYISAIKKVLEVNCGTGEDARWFASKGFTVEATDISKEMIDICKNKSIGGVNFSVCDSRTIGAQYKKEQFDLIFSDFGGLNCLDPAEIKQFLADSAGLLSPKGIVVAVIMGRKCFWEKVYFKKKKDKRLNRRSSKTGVETILNERKFLTHYYTPAEFYNAGKEHFDLLSCKPIGFFVPPSWFNGYFKNKKTLLKLLYSFEKLSSFSFLADRADHYLIVLQKKKTVVP